MPQDEGFKAMFPARSVLIALDFFPVPVIFLCCYPDSIPHSLPQAKNIEDFPGGNAVFLIVFE
jgi:hypothetical protein